MTIPNILTCIRAVLVPVFMVLAYQQDPVCQLLALIVYVVACATDFVDGYLARKWHQITDFGKFATEDFICREYSDHVEIDEYIGLTPLTEIPEKLRDKKVTKIRATTFKNKIEEVSARADSVKVPSSLKKQFAAALKK